MMPVPPLHPVSHPPDPAMTVPFVYRVTAVCVFLMGFALHLTNVVIGPDRLVATVFTPTCAPS